MKNSMQGLNVVTIYIAKPVSQLGRINTPKGKWSISLHEISHGTMMTTLWWLDYKLSLLSDVLPLRNRNSRWAERYVQPHP